MQRYEELYIPKIRPMWDGYDGQNPNYMDIDGVLFNKDCTIIIRYPEGKGGDSYKIPDRVNNIGECTFKNCVSLTSIGMSDSVTEIGGRSFFGCTSITTIEIPDSVTKIGEDAFNKCTNLKELHIRNKKPREMVIGKDAFKGLNDCTLYVPVGTGYAYRHCAGFAGKFKEVVIEK